MISEKKLVRLLDMNPFSVPKLYQRHDLPVFVKTALVLWQVIAVYTLIKLLIETNVFDIDTFVRKLGYAVILVFTMIGIYLILSTNRDHRFSIESLPELNSSLDIATSKYHVGVCITVIVFCLVAHVSAFTFLGTPSEIVFLINYMLFVSTNYTVVGFKHLVSKSTKAVVVKTIQSETPIKVVHRFRQVLTYNQSIEDIYSFSVLVGLSNGVFMILISLITYWNVYGFHKIFDCFESNHPFISIVSQHYAMFQFILLGNVSTKQLNNVSKCFIFFV